MAAIVAGANISAVIILCFNKSYPFKFMFLLFLFLKSSFDNFVFEIPYITMILNNT